MIVGISCYNRIDGGGFVVQGSDGRVLATAASEDDARLLAGAESLQAWLSMLLMAHDRGDSDACGGFLWDGARRALAESLGMLTFGPMAPGRA